MIGFYLHHVGDGHRTRGAVLARALLELGQPVAGLGSGGPPRQWPGDWVELDRDDQPAVDPHADDPTAHGVLHWAPLGHPGLLSRHAELVRWVEVARPSVLVVDVSVEVTLLARLCGIPVVVLAMPGWRSDRAHRTAYDLAERLLAPWPVTAHGADWPQRWRDKTWAVGGISQFAGRTPDPALAEPGRVLVLGGAGGSAVSQADVAAAQDACPGTRWRAVGGRHGRAADLWAELARAEVVVTHGGQNAVADVATARRPAVVVAQVRPHGEQQATAAAVERLGVAVGLDTWPRDPGAWPDLLHRARARPGDGWRDWVPSRPAETAAALLNDLATRELVLR